jgi:hypothetical protein
MVAVLRRHIYTAEANVTGGRNGHGRSSDGVLELDLRPPGGRAGSVGSEFRKWSGARDLNPGPHGPEPCRWRAHACPPGSATALLNPAAFVSTGDLP